MKKIILFLSFTIIILTACNTTKRRNFVLLVDISISVPEHIMKRYITTIQETILSNMGDKDKLTVEFIDGCSQNKAERIYSFDLADIDFTNSRDGVNHSKDSSQTRLRRYLLVNIKEIIAKTIIEKKNERRSCGNYTDIINALNEAKSLIENKRNYTNKTDKLINEAQGKENYQYETCVIIFSDMINENVSKTFDFTIFGRLKEEDVYKKVNELKDLNKIPNLKGAKILVYGATNTKEAGEYAGQQIDNVKMFWNKFFKYAGADIVGYGYDTNIEIEQYMKQMDK